MKAGASTCEYHKWGVLQSWPDAPLDLTNIRRVPRLWHHQRGRNGVQTVAELWRGIREKRKTDSRPLILVWEVGRKMGRDVLQLPLLLPRPLDQVLRRSTEAD